MIIFSVIGGIGFSELLSFLIISHGFFTSVLSISLVIYEIIQQVFVQGQFWDFFLSFPFIVDFFVGYFSLSFMKNIWAEKDSNDDARLNQDVSNNLNENFVSSDCCICRTKKADIILYNCGHRCLCLVCSKIFKKGSGKCPLCRKKIIDLIRIYE